MSTALGLAGLDAVRVFVLQCEHRVVNDLFGTRHSPSVLPLHRRWILIPLDVTVLCERRHEHLGSTRAGVR
jgi:hypothetical protein